MNKVCMSEDTRLNERYTMDTEGVDVYTLIDRASMRLEENLPAGRVLIVVGKGKNGADGISLATRLVSKREVKVYQLYEDTCVEFKRYISLYKSL